MGRVGEVSDESCGGNRCQNVHRGSRALNRSEKCIRNPIKSTSIEIKRPKKQGYYGAGRETSKDKGRHGDKMRFLIIHTRISSSEGMVKVKRKAPRPSERSFST